MDVEATTASDDVDNETVAEGGAAGVSGDNDADEGDSDSEPSATGGSDSAMDGDSASDDPATDSDPSGSEEDQGEEAVEAPTDDMLDGFFGEMETRNRVTPGQVCERLATIQCAGEASCCEAPGRTFEECKDEMLTGCEESLFLDAIAESRSSGFDAELAELAFQEYEDRARSCDPTVASIGEAVDGLRGIFQGTLEEGANCSPLQATDEPTLAAMLAACANPAEVACLPESAFRWRCRARGQSGESCLTDINCVEGLYCPQDNPVRPELGAKCAPRLALGESCVASNNCESLTCKGGECVEATVQATFCLR